ncbi:hypothetical protein SAY86_013136 [Trapa natans]|uniref:Uncharacterized protein n=1 Tax=Trapa natans TaxID=22666 RepID=A0AAN7MB92_TRANT|nr:hypothetical protein SAY86_013136 [Trapa natans]
MSHRLRLSPLSHRLRQLLKPMPSGWWSMTGTQLHEQQLLMTRVITRLKGTAGYPRRSLLCNPATERELLRKKQKEIEKAE